ncbi:calcitonin gene-related peptide type 1 receptor-like isoform X1 [Lates japonicus]|uniref:Calcitonin gene-related peptide type 1 receptor-like isoform X1 n=1 Tax=Lates japonicus TaxID=270547 RepID=A0AAD3QWA1_LATJO|nr:calcitonin gene-related peptide type 1 receptor-like isoform X1 [Lates japonicus]
MSTLFQRHGPKMKCFSCIMKESHRIKKTIAGPVCNTTWDGWLCWDELKLASQQSRAVQKTDDFDPHAVASKVCTETGEWGRHPESNRTWTNFTNCKANTTHHKTVRRKK